VKTVHEPVLLDETLEKLAPALAHIERPVLLDGTLGGGGHAEAFLERFQNLTLIGIDRDAAALERVKLRLERFASRIFLSQRNFSEFEASLAELGKRNGNVTMRVHAALFDLGMSSDQLDDEERGFSFRFSGPLDMRMDRAQEKTAADVINGYEPAELLRVFKRGGVGSMSKRLVEMVVRRRPISDAREFYAVCEEALKPVSKGKTASAVPFQAVRMEVNAEIESIERMLEGFPEALASGGRLAVITFHSLEDELVTSAMRDWSRAKRPRRDLPESSPAFGRLIEREAIVPSEGEIQRNARARSARLRIFQRNS
jgi:16S rRNA (cytosine1402-N4)-methyltransferase